MDIDELKSNIVKYLNDLDETNIRFLNQILIFIERYIKEKRGR